MYIRRNVFFSIVTFLIVLGFTSLTPFHNAEASTVGILKDVEGTVFVKVSGGKREISAYNGMEIRQGATIRTGKESAVTIDFGNENKSTLGELGLVTIAELSNSSLVASNEMRILNQNGNQVTVKQESGGLWSKVKNLFGAGNRHKVETSTAIMGVRGTLFYSLVDHENNEESVSVFDGVVGVENVNGLTFNNLLTEPKVNPSEQLIFTEGTGQKPTIVNYGKLFENLQPAIATLMILDTIEVAEEQSENARRVMDELGENADSESAMQAIEIAMKAELLATISERIVIEATKSSNSTEINIRLGRSQQSLQQLEQKVKEITKQTQETKQRIIETAIRLGVNEGEISTIVQNREKVIEEINKEQTVPPTTPPSSGAGGSTGPTTPIPTPENGIVIGTVNGKPGDIVKVPVRLYNPNNMDIVALQATIQTEHENLLTLNSISKINGSSIDSSEYTLESNITFKRILLGNIQNVRIPEGELFYIEFEISNTAQVNTIIDVSLVEAQFSNSFGLPIQVNVEAGSIKVVNP